MNFVLWAVLALLIIKVFAKLLLEEINLRYSSKAEVNKDFDVETHRKSFAYTLAKHKVHRVEILFSGLLLSFILLFGVLGVWQTWIDQILGSSLFAQASLIVLASFALGFFEIPFELYQTFKIESAFGFNKTTIKLWCLDKVKGVIIGLLIAYPLLMTLMFLVSSLGNHWWIYAALVVILFQLLMLVLYPMLIMPLFNQFNALEQGVLKDRLDRLAEKTNFKAAKVEVMDGSKRSSHSNAFFTGFGKFRKVVLFDTLVDQLSVDEMEAVLAHEIGHYKKGHIPKQLITSIFLVIFSFFIIDQLIQWPTFYTTFGLDPNAGLAPALLIFSLFSGVITYWIGPAFNILSRKNEYEADAFAKNIVGSGKVLVSALKKLSEKNLSNLKPHPWYSFFYHSHPTYQERKAALES